jgi:hypothetical protein
MMVRASLTINDTFIGIKHELDPESLLVRTDVPNGTSLIKKHKTFEEARKTLNQLRAFSKVTYEHYQTTFRRPSGEIVVSPPNMELIRAGYTQTLKNKFGFEDEKKLSPSEHIVFQTGLPMGFDPDEFTIPEYTTKDIGDNDYLVGVTDLGKDGKYRVSVYLGNRIEVGKHKHLFSKEGFADRDKAKEGISKLMGRLQRKEMERKYQAGVLEAERLYKEGKRGVLPPRSLIEKDKTIKKAYKDEEIESWIAILANEFCKNSGKFAYHKIAKSIGNVYPKIAKSEQNVKQAKMKS